MPYICSAYDVVTTKYFDYSTFSSCCPKWDEQLQFDCSFNFLSAFFMFSVTLTEMLRKMMLRCLFAKTVELVDLVEMRKTDCFGKTRLVLHTPSSSSAGKQICCYCHHSDASLLQAQVTAENTAANKLNSGGAFTVRMEGPANLWGKWQCHVCRATSDNAVCCCKCKWCVHANTSARLHVVMLYVKCARLHWAMLSVCFARQVVV